MKMEETKTWDGSRLKNANFSITTKNSVTRLLVGESIYLAKVDKYSELAVCDELCVMFGFAKIGTHIISKGNSSNTSYTIFKQDVVSFERIEIGGIDNALFRRRLQDYYVFRWIFGVPINHMKDLFIHDGKIYGRPTKPKDIELSNESWFYDTIRDSKSRLLSNRSESVIMREVDEAIKRINHKMMFLETRIRSRLSMV